MVGKIALYNMDKFAYNNWALQSVTRFLREGKHVVGSAPGGQGSGSLDRFRCAEM
jgi:hypothetical protein